VIPRPPDPYASDPEVVDALARVVNLLEQVAASLVRIEERQERTNELLDQIDRSQYS
jgi:hypothetical protein